MTPSPAALAITDRIIDRWNATHPESVRVAIAEVVEEVLKREAVLREALITAKEHILIIEGIEVLEPDHCEMCKEIEAALAATEPK